MECFNHEKSQAVGMCKSCFKAICKECAVDTMHGLACSTECELDVSEVNQMNERGKVLYGIGDRKSKVPSTGIIIWVLFSASMWGVFVYSYFVKGNVEYGSLATAIIFTIITIVTVYGARRTGLQC